MTAREKARGALRLARPTAAMRAAAEAYKREHWQCGEYELHGSALLDKMDYEEWLALVRDNERAETARPDWVVADTFFVVRSCDGRIVGMADIRHTLNDFLKNYGGNIGYGVRPSQRGRGYGAEILRLALGHAKAVGLKRALLACYADNIPSRRVIEGCAGRLARTAGDADGREILFYWIEL